MSTKLTLEQLLADTTPRTTTAESARILTYIESHAAVVVPVASSYFPYYFSLKPMSYMALVLVFLLGVTGTVAAAGSAKPGDLLFPIDRATEEVQLALASGTQKEALQNQFIAERFTELQEIVDEETVATTTGSSTNGIMVRPTGESRVANAVAVLASQLAHENDPIKREQYLQSLLHEVSSLHVEGRPDSALRLDETRVKIEDSKSDVRIPDERIEIEQKDGQVEIKHEDHGGESDSHDTEVRQNSIDASSTGLRSDYEGGHSGDGGEYVQENHESPQEVSPHPTSVASDEEQSSRGGVGGHRGDDREREEGGRDD